MKKHLAIAFLLLFTMAVATPSIAAMVDNSVKVSMTEDDKKDTKTATTTCTKEKAATCDKTSTEAKACCNKEAAKTTEKKACCTKDATKTTETKACCNKTKTTEKK